ncbi:MAG: thioredoxin domain-containing protein [Verrucomicrobiota bacterium]
MTPTHLAAEVSPAQAEHSNRLAHEKSPYLLQHAHNPVDWFPWGEEAFAKARRENKPIFLSVGYSTCHWCHVMAHESFENEQTAAIMNREFVNIKVDREERPDVDRVYMTFVQATTGSGGWPMSVWLTPDLKPFVGGTYFPPQDRYGQPGFKKVLEQIAAAWKQDHEKITEQGGKITAALKQAGESSASAEKLTAKTLDTAFDQIAKTFDAREGGFSGAPKFPRPVTLNFLCRSYARDPKSDSGKRALEMHLFTLRKMAAGGIHDHLGGGFHRYSVDAHWHVPHFEKMLYDQAQLANAYLDAFQITQDRQYETVARDILDYVRRDMTAKDGGFFSAEDADSLLELGKAEHAEGAFYVWTKSEIDKALGTAAEIFDFHFGVELHGNAPPGSDPQGEFREKNILIERHTIAETARHFKKSEDEIRESIGQSREKLLSIRTKRPRPHLDDKIITSWNGLMISAFARAGQILNDQVYVDLAARAAKFAQQNLYDDARKVLTRNFRDGKSQVEGFADDYAFLIQGLLDLYEASFDVTWLKFAIELQETQDRLFLDQKNGGYFSGSGNDPSILLRMKEDNDSAEPAPSSVAALNLLRLAQIRDDKDLRERGEKTINAFGAQLNQIPLAMPQMLVALDYSLSKPRQIVIAGKIDNKDTQALLREVHRHFLPNKILLLADGGDGQKYLSENLAAIGAMSMVDDKPAAYVCENFTCKAPVTDPVELRKLL